MMKICDIYKQNYVHKQENDSTLFQARPHSPEAVVASENGARLVCSDDRHPGNSDCTST